MILLGDCIDVLRGMEAESVDAVITDPPYFLTNDSGSGFMSKEWDSAKDWFTVIRWHRRWLKECYRVMKPGATLFAFAGTRTDDLLKLAARLAGFEIRDTLLYLYGAGFPKAQDLGAIYDKDACRTELTAQLGRPPTKAEFKKAWETFREVVGRKPISYPDSDRWGEPTGARRGKHENVTSYYVADEELEPGKPATAPATELAREWDGWKVGGLKPAYEPILMARKPCEGSTVANILKHGVGALNIAACRVELEDGANLNAIQRQHTTPAIHISGIKPGDELPTYNPAGRYPSHLLFDDSAAALLDEQSGECKSAGLYETHFLPNPDKGAANIPLDGHNTQKYNDTGGASRFFTRFSYTPKSCSWERNAGLATKEFGVGTSNAHPT